MPHLFNETDLKIDLDQLEDRGSPWGWLILEGCQPWSMIGQAQAFLGMTHCPVCNAGRLHGKQYCLGCDKTGMDSKVEFQGLPVGQCLDPEWSAEATAFVPHEKLSGGKGKAKARAAAGLTGRISKRRSIA